MRTITIVTGIMIVCAVVFSSQAAAQVQMGLTATDKGVQSFYLGVGQYYHVPDRDVVFIRERHIPDDEIPVVCFIAHRAHVEPAAIVDLRMQGQSWMDISLHYGLGPDVYYVPVKQVSGPPYGKAYGYYKNHPRREWRKIRLSDDEIVNFVNLRFMTEHYGYDAPAVMRARGEGKSFVVIQDEGHGWKHGHDEGDEDHGRGKGHGHGNGNGKHKGWKDGE